MIALYVQRWQSFNGKSEFQAFLKKRGLRVNEVSCPESKKRFVNSCELYSEAFFQVITGDASFAEAFPWGQRHRRSFEDLGEWTFITSNVSPRRLHVRFMDPVPIQIFSSQPIYWWFNGHFITDTEWAAQQSEQGFLVNASGNELQTVVRNVRLNYRIHSGSELPDYRLSVLFFEKEQKFAIETGNKMPRRELSEIPLPTSFGGFLKQGDSKWAAYWEQTEEVESYNIHILGSNASLPNLGEQFLLVRSFPNERTEVVLAVGEFQ